MFTIDDDDNANPANIDDDNEVEMEYQPIPPESDDDFDDEVMSLGYSESENDLDDASTHKPSNESAKANGRVTLSRDSGSFSGINTPNNDDIDGGLSQTTQIDTNSNAVIADDPDDVVQNADEANSNEKSSHAMEKDSSDDPESAKTNGRVTLSGESGGFSGTKAPNNHNIVGSLSQTAQNETNSESADGVLDNEPDNGVQNADGANSNENSSHAMEPDSSGDPESAVANDSQTTQARTNVKSELAGGVLDKEPSGGVHNLAGASTSQSVPGTSTGGHTAFGANSINSNPNAWDKVLPGHKFDVIENHARYYIEYEVVLRNPVCTFIQMYNTNEALKHQKFDETFLRCVLLEIFRKSNIKAGSLDKHKMKFAEKLFMVHVGQTRRVDFNKISKKVLKSLHDKFKKESEAQLLAAFD